MHKYSRVKFACYTSNSSMAIVSHLSPVLFLTFRELYGISYSLLGLLVVINFTTQLIVDLAFSFFSHKFNIPKVVKATPLITLIGLLIYAVWPLVLPELTYLGLAIGTIIFSAASGFNEVLISPIIAAIPSDEPDREMSKLHSIYAWAVVGVVVISTLFLLVFGKANWYLLVFLLMLIPLISFVSFVGAKIPDMEKPEKIDGAISWLKNKTLWLFVVAIFLGGASECTMSQWSSSYLEKALSIPKVWGDIFGVALFGLMLALGRTLYAKVGKNIEKVLFLGSIGAAVCYFVATVSLSPVLGLAACALTGLCTSMLWPGCLVAATDSLKSSSVFIFAIMAAGGDLGGSVGPQLVGLVTDTAMCSPFFAGIAQSFGLTAEQFGMKLGLLSGMLFPVLAIIIFGYIKLKKNKRSSDYGSYSKGQYNKT